jgi:hypothetical protein
MMAFRLTAGRRAAAQRLFWPAPEGYQPLPAQDPLRQIEFQEMHCGAADAAQRAYDSILVCEVGAPVINTGIVERYYLSGEGINGCDVTALVAIARKARECQILCC